MKRLLVIATALLVQGVSAFAPVQYDKLYHAIGRVESDNGVRSRNTYQLTERFVRDIGRISGREMSRFAVYDDDKARKAMQTYWVYYGSRYEARTGKPATAEILSKLHHVGYRGLWTRPSEAEHYWRKVRLHYYGGNAKKETKKGKRK